MQTDCVRQSAGFISDLAVVTTSTTGRYKINLYELWVVILLSLTETSNSCIRAQTFLSEYLTTDW